MMTLGQTAKSISALIAFALATAPAAADQPALQVRSSQLDSSVKQFDEPNIVIANARETDAPLVIFLSGTSGKPANAARLMEVVAGQGYRVIGLEYDDEPAVVQVCPRDPDPDCSAKFREMRLTGTGDSRAVSNPVAEAIIPRLVTLLRALDREQPKIGWAGYLDGDQPRWSRIVVSGLSQGAGMAAFIAKQHAVRRVVLFSSPWEFTGADRHPAPWLSNASATPFDRWFAEYHAREKTVPLIVAAYGKLSIPAANIRVFRRDLPRGVDASGPNPYHGITIRDPGYADDWRAMYGRASDPAG